MKILLSVAILSLLLSGCSLFPSTWKSARPPVGEPSPAVTSAPTQTTEDLDAQVTADLETQMDADLKQIDTDLKTIESESLQY